MKIIPYELNAKKHPVTQIKALAEAIKHFGFSPAIEVDTKGVIVSGHGRFLAAQELGWKAQKESARARKGEKFIPYVILDDLSEVEIALKRLGDNKLAQSDMDMILLLEDQKKIVLMGGNLELAGYDNDMVLDPVEPINLDAENQLKSPRLIIMFTTFEDLENAKEEIQKVIDNYKGSYISSMGGGEL